MNQETLSQLISIISSILVIVGTYKIFEKAGDEGWKAIIPFYNSYTQYKLTWNTKMFWICLLAEMVAVPSALIFAGCAKAGIPYAVIISGIIMIASVAIVVTLHAKESSKLAHAFGKGTGFAVGLFFLQPIFKMILGFDNNMSYVK